MAQDVAAVAELAVGATPPRGHHRPSSVREDHVIESALNDGNKKINLWLIWSACVSLACQDKGPVLTISANK